MKLFPRNATIIKIQLCVNMQVEQQQPAPGWTQRYNPWLDPAAGEWSGCPDPDLICTAKSKLT